MGGPGSGRVARPALQIVKEGNPGRRPVKEPLKLPPAKLAEPDWATWFPFDEGELDSYSYRRQSRAESAQLCQAKASEEWRLIVPMLDAQGLLAGVDLRAVTDYCVTAARLLQAEREVSIEGLTVPGATAGTFIANPSIRAANAYRAALLQFAHRFGLTPADRNGLGGKGSSDADDDEDPFD